MARMAQGLPRDPELTRAFTCIITVHLSSKSATSQALGPDFGAGFGLDQLLGRVPQAVAHRQCFAK